VAALLPEFPEAVAFQYALPNCAANYEPFHDANVCLVEKCSSSLLDLLPQPLFQYAKQFTSAADFIANLPKYNCYEINKVEEATRKQAECKTWFEHRRGRISASVARRVFTKSRKLLLDCSASADSLIREILSSTETKALETPAIIYGKMNKPVAALAYEQVQQLSHTGFKVSKCGLFIDADAAKLCASPDSIVCCDCCGDGLLAIKCPKTSEDICPSQANLKFLSWDDRLDRLIVKLNHAYNSQIQMQMGVTGRKWSDFFVYSEAGTWLERINFDADYWQTLKAACQTFYREHVAEVVICE
jgi:hypothetical protein